MKDRRSFEYSLQLKLMDQNETFSPLQKFPRRLFEKVRKRQSNPVNEKPQTSLKSWWSIIFETKTGQSQLSPNCMSWRACPRNKSQNGSGTKLTKKTTAGTPSWKLRKGCALSKLMTNTAESLPAERSPFLPLRLMSSVCSRPSSGGDFLTPPASRRRKRMIQMNLPQSPLQSEGF